ncbi:glycosyltransferase family 2 protein [Phaeovulum vinaykumarii]|uniref:Glycosyltransferase involved in cell wall bisynthesis n=1 Tax=Phaeovulum vinaykumarii TaxID=407234 RepID=A0A1N7MBQ8_9RHOB|nr:glycosyltransferase family 2 protein [Phaeovulum vinaykumarii]SIS83488.1 Glycosyltransferase involved in cell wall bisynthesis [Phaeovulum vinaykumarii]SOC10188.1 glycosyltransferase involved in cell wall bisynthesis [Phaeovulum vinaykumarii]
MTQETPPLRPRIAVLMATRDGAAHLRAQLDSIAAQSLPPAWVVVSDDGSRDGTRRIVEDFAARHPAIAVEWRDGPRRGAARNFLMLIRHPPPEADMIALSDQDDVWCADKLERGAAALAGLPDGMPGLFCGRTWACDADLNIKWPSRQPARPPSFRHALVQSLAGGNTMMMNRAGQRLLAAASREARKIVMHDWWIYQIMTGAGGKVIFSAEPLLYYRQHGGNAFGANRGLAARIWRMRLMLAGRFNYWNSLNIKALRASRHRLTAENRALLEAFVAMRRAPLLVRIRMQRHLKFHREDLPANLSLWAAVILGRL